MEMNNSHTRERGGERDETRNKSRNPTGRDCGGGGRGGGGGGGKEIEKCIVHRTWLRKEHTNDVVEESVSFVFFIFPRLRLVQSRPTRTRTKKTTDEEDDRREPSIRLCVCVCGFVFFCYFRFSFVSTPISPSGQWIDSSRDRGASCCE